VVENDVVLFVVNERLAYCARRRRAFYKFQVFGVRKVFEPIADAFHNTVVTRDALVKRASFVATGARPSYIFFHPMHRSNAVPPQRNPDEHFAWNPRAHFL
jgi:hypothetical protein